MPALNSAAPSGSCFFMILIIVKAAFGNFKEQRSDRGGAGLGRQLLKIVVQLFDAGAITLAHRGHPVAAMLALGAERKRHGRWMVAAQLGGTDNLRKMDTGELLLPAISGGIYVWPKPMSVPMPCRTRCLCAAQ